MQNERISEFLQSRIDALDFPSAVYLIAEKGEIVWRDALGFAVVEPEKIEAKLDTIYDLASLTKPLVTGLLCAKLVEKKKLELNKSIEFYLTDLHTAESARTTDYFFIIRNFLTHGSLLPAWKPFYLFAPDREKILSAIFKNSIDWKDQRQIITYSDLNFMVLGFLLEKIYGNSLDNIAKEEIFAPLKLADTFFNPPKNLQKRIAASEKGNEYEKQTCIDSGYDVSKYNWRDYQIWGEAHDGNCHFMKGVSGHAGLFSTAEETYKIALEFLPNSTTLLKPETCKLFRTNFTEGLNEARSIAFQLAATKDSTAGASLAKDSFGHLGFTGTSLWIEPETERIFILLTNRTHARGLPFANINAARRKFHDLAAETLDAKER